MVTTLSIQPQSKDRFERHRHGRLHNDGQVLESLMDIVPDYEELQEGCIVCGHSPNPMLPVNEVGGVIAWFENDGVTFSSWFCSADCVASISEDEEVHVPENPDMVIVGGKDMPRSRIASGTHYMLDDEAAAVRIDVPGAFTGETVEGEYNYFGEPVYLKDHGRWIGSGVVEDIIHEEGHTCLVLGGDSDVEREHHPSDRLREEYGPVATGGGA